MTHEYLRKRVAEYFGFDTSKPFWIDERNEDGEFSPAPSLEDDIEFFDYAVPHSRTGEILIYEAPRPTHWLDGKPCGTNATYVVYGTKE